MSEEVKSEQRDSIKLVKNSRGFNWEIKIYAKEGVDIFDQIDEANKKYKSTNIT